MILCYRADLSKTPKAHHSPRLGRRARCPRSQDKKWWITSERPGSAGIFARRTLQQKAMNHHEEKALMRTSSRISLRDLRLRVIKIPRTSQRKSIIRVIGVIHGYCLLDFPFRAIHAFRGQIPLLSSARLLVLVHPWLHSILKIKGCQFHSHCFNKTLMSNIRRRHHHVSHS